MKPVFKVACLITSLALASLAIAYEGGYLSAKPAPAAEDRILPSSKSRAFTSPPTPASASPAPQKVILPSSKSFTGSTSVSSGALTQEAPK
jgi:hypothetical protein